MAKIIFLDNHGVLTPMTHDGAGYSPACIAALNRITEATRARIVLTCSWRANIAEELIAAGVKGFISGRTRDGDEPRWRQIADWLKSPPVKVERYCIIDDDTDAFGGRPGVLTNGATGLTEADADEAIEILGV